MTAKKPDGPEVHRATDQLVTYLCATRTDWDEQEVRNIIGGATNIGMAWNVVSLGLHTIAHAGGRPTDLAPVTQNTTEREHATRRRGYYDARAGLGLPLIDPDCRDGKCVSCAGGPCEHECHTAGSLAQVHKEPS